MWESKTTLSKSIEKAHLDFDDDFYMYTMKSTQYENKFIELWEHYEIHHTIPRKLLHYGNWTIQNDGLKLVTEEKWTRRKDLHGISFRILSLPHPGVSTMTPINEDLFEFTGMMPDIWHNIQVFVYHILTIKPQGAFGKFILELGS